jgi:NADH-quinone oxidoreductase subunit H
MLNFIIKCSLGVLVMMWVRWTLPRLRIDQVMKLCLKYCVPIAAVMFLGATVWTYLLPGGIGLRKMPYGERYGVAMPAAEKPPIETIAGETAAAKEGE